MNVRVQFEGELAQTATSLEAALSRPLDRAALLGALLERVDFWTAQLESDALFQTWKARLTTIGQRVEVGDIAGVAEGVDASGALLIRLADGSIRRVMAGDVSLLTPPDEG